jgi:hypothetical protein
MNTPWYQKQVEQEKEALGLSGPGTPAAKAPAAAPAKTAEVVKQTVQEEIKDTTPPEQVATPGTQQAPGAVMDETGNIKL